jgi:glycine/D-amino acid oxidase-like deaminating enzyme
MDRSAGAGSAHFERAPPGNMARIVIVGAEIVGLGTALLLAGNGQEVTVLERDPSATPRSTFAMCSATPRRSSGLIRA